MVPVNLDKPGRLYVTDRGNNYRVYQHRFGCLEIERISDGATAFFQGDDVGILTDALVHAEGCDVICQGYDHVLTLEG